MTGDETKCVCKEQSENDGIIHRKDDPCYQSPAASNTGKELGRQITVTQAINMLKRSNEWLQACDFTQTCDCGSCWKCAIQKISSEIAALQNELDTVRTNAFEDDMESGKKINKLNSYGKYMEKLNSEAAAKIAALEKRNAELYADRQDSHKVIEEQAAELDGYDLRLELLEQKLKTAEDALAKIAEPDGCGCSGYCRCDSESHLRIWKVEAKSLAEEALKERP